MHAPSLLPCVITSYSIHYTKLYDGPPNQAQLQFPAGSNPPPAGSLAFDDKGRLYISDTLNQRIRRVDFTADRIETIAGTGVAGYAGDGGPATDAQLNNRNNFV